MADIRNTDDLIDSRDVIARIEELESECDGVEMNNETSTYELDGQDMTDQMDELRTLRALADSCEGYGDWEHGETLIRADYFATYAEALAEDIGAIDRDAKWPLMHLDWDAAADDLKVDYMSVDFDGEEYFMRSC